MTEPSDADLCDARELWAYYRHDGHSDDDMISLIASALAGRAAAQREKDAKICDDAARTWRAHGVTAAVVEARALQAESDAAAIRRAP